MNTALATATSQRVGRPAKQNYISLLCLVADDDVQHFDASAVAPIERTELAHSWAAIHLFDRGWCPAAVGDRERELLESEWKLRLVLLGAPFVSALVAIDETAHGLVTASADLLEIVKRIHGPGTQQTTRDQTEKDLVDAVDSWPDISGVDLSDFWSQGQTRAGSYEDALRIVLPGYDTTGDGFLGHRPDYIVSPFQPCSILEAVSDEQPAINAAIRREAHAFEFTANNTMTAKRITDYLADKMAAYVKVTQEQ